MLADAINYLRRSGSLTQRAQAAAWQAHQTPTGEVQSALLDGQASGGGWPAFWSGNIPSIDATCYRLTQALSAPISPAELAMSLTWLECRQLPDDTWAEEEEMRDLAPPWARPGQQDATLYLTANAGWVLQRAGRLAAGRSAGRYLSRYLSGEARLPSSMQTHWLSAGLWLMTGQPEADRVLDMLTTAVPSLSAGELVWMGNCLLDSGTPTSHPLMQTGVLRLLRLQQPDGSWPNDDDPSLTPQTTLEGIRFLLQLAS